MPPDLVKTRISEFIHMKKTNRKPYKDLELIQKIKAERQQANITKHPSNDLMLKRNQIIRKRYAIKAKELFLQSKTLSSAEQKEKYFKAAKLLEKFAIDMPREVTRGHQVYNQLNTIYSYNVSKDKNTNMLNEPRKDNNPKFSSVNTKYNHKYVKEQRLEMDLDFDD